MTNEQRHEPLALRETDGSARVPVAVVPDHKRQPTGSPFVCEWDLRCRFSRKAIVLRVPRGSRSQGLRWRDENQVPLRIFSIGPKSEYEPAGTFRVAGGRRAARVARAIIRRSANNNTRLTRTMNAPTMVFKRCPPRAPPTQQDHPHSPGMNATTSIARAPCTQQLETTSLAPRARRHRPTVPRSCNRSLGPPSSGRRGGGFAQRVGGVDLPRVVVPRQHPGLVIEGHSAVIGSQPRRSRARDVPSDRGQARAQLRSQEHQQPLTRTRPPAGRLHLAVPPSGSRARGPKPSQHVDTQIRTELQRHALARALEPLSLDGLHETDGRTAGVLGTTGAIPPTTRDNPDHDSAHNHDAQPRADRRHADP
jgi:hypothetical protein